MTVARKHLGVQISQDDALSKAYAYLQEEVGYILNHKDISTALLIGSSAWDAFSNNDPDPSKWIDNDRQNPHIKKSLASFKLNSHSYGYTIIKKCYFFNSTLHRNRRIINDLREQYPHTVVHWISPTALHQSAINHDKCYSDQKCVH